MVVDECHVAGARHIRFVAFAEQYRSAARYRDRPDLHLRLRRAAVRIRLKISVRGPVGAVIAAAHVNDAAAIARESQIGQFLSVVVGVPRQALRFEVRSAGHVDVSHTAFDQGPRDGCSGWRSDEVVRERKIEHLLERERRHRRRLCPDEHAAGDCDTSANDCADVTCAAGHRRSFQIGEL